MTITPIKHKYISNITYANTKQFPLIRYRNSFDNKESNKNADVQKQNKEIYINSKLCSKAFIIPELQKK